MSLFLSEEVAMQLLRPCSTKNKKCGRINESGEAGVVLTEPQRDVLAEIALVGFTCPGRVVLSGFGLQKNSILKMLRTSLFVRPLLITNENKKNLTEIGIFVSSFRFCHFVFSYFFVSVSTRSQRIGQFSVTCAHRESR